MPTIGKNNGVVVIIKHIVFQDKTCTVAIILVSHELVLTSLFLGQNNVANELDQTRKKIRTDRIVCFLKCD